MFAQVFVVHTNPSPRKTHSAANQMKRVQGDESPWRSLGRVAPAYSPRKAWQSQYDHAKAHLRPTADSVPRLFRFPAFPRLLRPPSGSPQKTRKPKVNQPSRITAPAIRERATGDPDPRRNRNATYRRPSCLALCVKQQARSNARRRNRLARPADQPPRAQTLLPALKPAKRNIAPARNSRSYKARQRIAATARCSAQGHILRFPIPARGHRLLRTSRPKHTPPRRIHASAQISAGRHFQ